MAYNITDNDYENNDNNNNVSNIIYNFDNTVLCELFGTSEGTLSPSPAMDTRKFRLTAERYLQV
jgi:hypothetical protein